MLQLIENWFPNLLLEINTFHTGTFAMLLVNFCCEELLKHLDHFKVARKASDIDRHRASGGNCLVSSIYQQEATKLSIIVPRSPMQRSEKNDFANEIYASAFADEHLYDLKALCFDSF